MSDEARAEQLVEAMARERKRHAPAATEGEYGICACGEWDGDPAGFALHVESAALNVVRTEREMVPCDDCEASGIVVEADPPYDAIQCFRCKGTKSVPGELLVVGLIGEPYAWVVTTDKPGVVEFSNYEGPGRVTDVLYRINQRDPARIIEREAPQ